MSKPEINIIKRKFVDECMKYLREGETMDPIIARDLVSKAFNAGYTAGTVESGAKVYKPFRATKKPVTVDVIQYLEEDNLASVQEFFDERNGKGKFMFDTYHDSFYIDTLEGKMKLSKYDYIICGVKGEFYPVKPDIFEETYSYGEDLHAAETCSIVGGGRQVGKTVALAKYSAESQIPVMVTSAHQAARMMEIAGELGLMIPTPIISYDYAKEGWDGLPREKPNHVIIDDLERVVKDLLGGVELAAASTVYKLKEFPVIVPKEK